MWCPSEAKEAVLKEKEKGKDQREGRASLLCVALGELLSWEEVQFCAFVHASWGWAGQPMAEQVPNKHWRRQARNSAYALLVQAARAHGDVGGLVALAKALGLGQDAEDLAALIVELELTPSGEGVHLEVRSSGPWEKVVEWTERHHSMG